MGAGLGVDVVESAVVGFGFAAARSGELVEVVLRKSDVCDAEGLEAYLSGGKGRVVARGRTFRATVFGVVGDDIFHLSHRSAGEL